jgi:HEAT repeat protein
VVIWLIKLFLLHPDLTTKAKALQSLAWIGENISSRDWIIKVLRSPEMQDALQSLNFTVDDLPDNLLQWVIVNIVLWDVDAMMQLGFVSEMGPLPDKEARAQQRARLYLRRKAIEAIAWVGDRSIVEQLQDQVHTWHIHLREVWYTTTALIDSRQKQVSLW